MKVLDDLKDMGYEVTLTGENIKAKYILPGDPPIDKVVPLLTELREHKTEILLQLKFKNEFDKLMKYLNGCDLNPDEVATLQTLATDMDEAWNQLNFPVFKNVIDKMMSVHEYPVVEEKPVSRPRWQRPDGSCYVCHSTGSWVSIYGVILCSRCHPPACPEIVKEWLHGTA